MLTNACTDFDFAVTPDGSSNFTYDCTNGTLTNTSGNAYTSADTPFHLVNVGATPGDTGAEANNDKVYLLYDTEDTNAGASTSTEYSNYDSMVKAVSLKLKDWTLSEARYWAYKAAYETHDALVDTAKEEEETLLTIKENKDDLVTAAN